MNNPSYRHLLLTPAVCLIISQQTDFQTGTKSFKGQVIVTCSNFP